MNQQEAQQVLMAEIFVPVYFDKLAAYGIVPDSEEEAARLLSIGQKLLQSDQAQNVKKASSRVDFLKAAEQRLDQEMASLLGVSPQEATNRNEYLDKIAEVCGSNTRIQEAVESFNAGA